MALLILLLAGLQSAPETPAEPAKKQPPAAVVSPPAPVFAPLPPPRPFPPRAPMLAPPPAPPPLTAPLDLAIVKQPKLDKFYPKDLRKAGLTDSAAIALTIDRKGKVTACRIRAAPANPAFAAPACALGAKLRFAAASFDYPGPLPIKIEWRTEGVALVRAVPPKRPSLVPGSITVSEEDYPAAMRRASIEGRQVADIMIAADGTPGSCTITWSTVSADFDAATCRVARRGRFLPAHDEFGVAVAGRVLQPIRWKLDQGEPVPAVSYTLVLKAKFSAAGKMVSCVPSATGSPPGPISAICDKDISEMLRAFPTFAGLAGRAAVLTINSALTMDGDPGFNPPAARTPRATAMYGRSRFDIADDGTVTNCREVEKVGNGGDICAVRIGPFTVAKGGARSGSYYLGVIIEPAP